MHRTTLIPCAGVCALLWAAAALSFAQAQPQNRIVQPINQSQMISLRGNVHPLARPEFDQGEVNPGMEMQNVSIIFKLSTSQQTALDELISEQQNPSSPNYRKWLTPEQYAARFGMSQNDLDQVTTWLQAQGFSGIQISRSRTRVSFNGTAAQVEAALHTEIHSYLVKGESHFANAADPALPAAFADTVLAFHRLNSFRPEPRIHRPTAHFTSSISGNHFLTPGDFATIYDLTPLYNLGIDGSAVTIAVVGQTVIPLSADAAFRAAAGLPAKAPTLLLTPNTGVSTTSSGDLDEANLDVEWSGGVAKGATVLFDYAGSTGDVFNALMDAIDNNRAPVIGISYGNCEANIGSPTFVQSLRTLAQQGVSQGQTVSAASGDEGAADCEDSTSTSATTGLAVDVPGAIPEVTSVGGSEFTGDSTLGSDPPYWQGGSSDIISSALTYIPEMAWNDTATDHSLSAGGGGVSTVFTKPSWQAALTPVDGKRDVPDIALSGSDAHDSYLVCSGLDAENLQSCANGFRDSQNNLDAFGGTSVSAQAFAGVLAILNQATNSHGLGNANIELYTLAASTPAAFHDITTGNNMVPCTAPSTNCPTGTTQIGYSAGVGYDLATGLGSLDVNALARAWTGFAGGGTTTVVTSSSLTAALGANVTFTATVTPGISSGTVPTGTVQFVIDGSNSGGATAIANGTATLQTGTLALGTHTVLAIYSGDTNYSGSTSASITETIANGFTVSGTATTISSPGGMGTSTVTVTPGTGFSGAVNLTCVAPASVEITCSFGSTTPVTISGGANGTATLTVTTTAPHALARTKQSADGRPHGKASWFMASGGALFAGFLMLGFPSRKRRWTILPGLLFFVFLAAGVGCGGGSSSGGGGGQTDPGTPVNTYTVVVTGTGATGGFTSTANVMVAVQ